MKTVPEAGDKVTVHNINPLYVDRNYQEEIWEVIATNKTHAQLKCMKPRAPLSNNIIVLMVEYEFAEAKTFIV